MTFSCNLVFINKNGIVAKKAKINANIIDNKTIMLSPHINIFIELIPFRVQLIQNLRFYYRKILKRAQS
ncbi:hypothetical protein SCO02_03490 [Staphylococcus ureilyticus]|uniref:Uncharacterized protein n=1 Tax=Staphylococcus ureilyticus TaxID=94138 RepID=A0AB34AFK8_STAUR|nr:hypothetical protein [Staphylococcus ureilyticus]GEQ01908.1 hypothetical protein SCO02_03490 [Staphylococcus ureilyticus]